MIRRKYIIAWIAGACLLAAAGIALARQADPVTRWLIGGGGGGKATGGNISIYGAAGQPVSGAVGGGSVKLCSGFWCGGAVRITQNILALPILMKRLAFYAPPCGGGNHYCEENDDLSTAYGPLAPGQNYSAYPEDQRDHYYIHLGTTGTATFTVTGFQNAGWLQIYDADDPANDIGSDNKEAGTGTLAVTLSNLAPGKYYIRMFNSGANTSAYLYTLKADY